MDQPLIGIRTGKISLTADRKIFFDGLRNNLYKRRNLETKEKYERRLRQGP
jgi:hypothetical protein